VLPRRGYLRPGDIEELKSVAAPIGFAFAALLLVAAANLASLVLARFAARRKELAVRAAVGAPRRRLLSQLFTECVMLALAAAVLGFALAAALVDPLHQAMIGALGELSIEMRPVHVDARVFGYGLALALLAALTFGGVPAWLATAPWRRGGGADVDVGSMQRASHSRLRSVLMVTQLAASVVLLVLASLIAANARVGEKQALGYDPERLVALRIPPTARLRDALLALPQVQGVAAVSHFPLMMNAVAVDARVGERSLPLKVRDVEASYFDVMGLPILQGRALRRGDEGARGLAISRRTAERLWPGRNAVGQRIELPPQENLDAGESGTYEVLAVVEDAVSGLFIGGIDSSAVYLPKALDAPSHRALLMRVPDSTRATLAALLRACVAAAPENDCELLPLRSALRLQHTPFMVAATTAIALGWTALAISCVGLYGLVSYLVQSRRRELGVRLALGASTGRVVRHVLSQATRQIALGLAVGLPLAFGMSRLAASVSEQLHVFDLGSFVGWPLLLAALALGAAWIPARRTAAIAPTEALREE
jgi:predicted permease